MWWTPCGQSFPAQTQNTIPPERQAWWGCLEGKYPQLPLDTNQSINHRIVVLQPRHAQYDRVGQLVNNMTFHNMLHTRFEQNRNTHNST